MNIIETPIKGLLIIEPKVFKDERGYFLECYNSTQLLEKGISNIFVQDNESKSARGTIRGLHYQLAPYAQTKLVRVITGSVYDVAVDLRFNSPTFGKWFGIELNEDNKLQLLIPRGFAHGFSVLSDYTVFSYKCDQIYNPQAERGIRFDDQYLNIDWKINKEEAIISSKDLQQADFGNAEFNF